jgi:hypothetical protein
MIELVACRSCGNMMLEGENAQGKITQKATKGYEAFQVDTDDENEIKNNLQQHFNAAIEAGGEAAKRAKQLKKLVK